jgi:hypothetical protein
VQRPPRARPCQVGRRGRRPGLFLAASGLHQHQARPVRRELRHVKGDVVQPLTGDHQPGDGRGRRRPPADARVEPVWAGCDLHRPGGDPRGQAAIRAGLVGLVSLVEQLPEQLTPACADIDQVEAAGMAECGVDLAQQGQHHPGVGGRDMRGGAEMP